MKLLDNLRDSLEQAEAGTDARLQKAREEKGIPTWLATILDVATLAVCLFLIFELGGVWILPGALFGGIAVLELINRTIEWIKA